jgi:hypothetical protein
MPSPSRACPRNAFDRGERLGWACQTQNLTAKNAENTKGVIASEVAESMQRLDSATPLRFAQNDAVFSSLPCVKDGIYRTNHALFHHRIN